MEPAAGAVAERGSRREEPRFNRVFVGALKDRPPPRRYRQGTACRPDLRVLRIMEAWAVRRNPELRA